MKSSCHPIFSACVRASINSPINPAAACMDRSAQPQCFPLTCDSVRLLVMSALPVIAKTFSFHFCRPCLPALGILGLAAMSIAAAPPDTKLASIPFDQIGAVAGKQYSGDGLGVVSSSDGARLRCDFQRLNARVTPEGLWLASTVDGARGEPFRVIACALGRKAVEMLPLSGQMAVTGQAAQFIRPGLKEEYSVSMDGVRQDFVIEQRPVGKGPVRLELKVDGANVEAMAAAVRLSLNDGGRRLVYNRLIVRDARGREVKARMEVLSADRLAIVLEDAAAEYPVRIDPTFSDANWSGLLGGGIPGVNGRIFTAAVDGAGNLYIGGQFSVPNLALTNFARWNGSSWSTLGSGLNGSSAVTALAVSGTNLYAAGIFTTAGGVLANNIAQWNGSAWSALGTGISGSINTLFASNNTLYAGGLFTTAGGVSAKNIAQWNGTSWSSLGPGIGNNVNALAVSGSTLYAGGQFTNVGGTTANNIAQWNGTSWSALGSGMAGFGVATHVSTLLVSGSTLYAGGDFTTAGGISANYLAKWNGSTWTAVGSGMNGAVSALALSAGTLYAGGFFTTAGGSSATYVAQWNGSVWSAMNLGMSGGDQFGPYVSVLLVSGSTIYAVGDFITADGMTANDVAAWNGADWSALPGAGSSINGTVFALAVSGSSVYVGGDFTSAGGGVAKYIAQWNGSGWSGLGSGMDDDVEALAVSGTNLYAGGDFTTAGGVSANYIARWNGSAWSPLGSGMNSDVFTLAVSGANLYAGGFFTTAGGMPANFIAQWNGSAWSALGSGTDSYVDALAVSGGTLYAGGGFYSAGISPAHYIAQWNGSTWSALGSGVDIDVYALAVSGNTLYAGGEFYNAGGISASHIARWDGSSWSALGSGMDSAVFALAATGNFLYAGGAFTNAGGVSASNIAQWDGSSWSALGSGMNNNVQALALSGTNLYAGGYFTTAGTDAAFYVARAGLDLPQDLGTALDATNLTWITGGEANWFVETTNTYDGISAAQSGHIIDNQTSFLQTTIPSDGQVSFFWKVSSEQDHDYLTFYINGIARDSISGEVDWTQDSYSVYAGDVLRWEYSKDGANSAGADAGWLDQVLYTPPAAPVSVSLVLQIDRLHYQDFSIDYTNYSLASYIGYISPTPVTTNLVVSPDGLVSSEVWPGFSNQNTGTEANYSSLDDLIQAVTNGQWTLYFNQGDPSEQVFHFNVFVNGLGTNLGDVEFLMPTNGAVNVAATSLVQWNGPVNFSSVQVGAYQPFPIYVSEGSTNLDASVTNWPSPPVFLSGTNVLYIEYALYNSLNLFLSTPVESDLTPVAEWNPEVDLYSDTYAAFDVGTSLQVHLIVSPQSAGAGDFQFSVQTVAGRAHEIQYRTNLTAGMWVDDTNFIGDGSVRQFTFPTTNSLAKYFRVITQ